VLIEGILYTIDWENFTVGSSFFIPCVDDVTAKHEIMRVMTRLKYAVILKIVIEDEIRGLRVWRVHRYNPDAMTSLLSPLS
jgi:hypothetical protein